MSRRRGRPRRDPVPPPAATVPEPEPVQDPYADLAGRDWTFRFLPDAPPEVVDEGALHHLMKDWRHGRATRTIGQALSDAYFTLFAVVLLGAMVTNVVLSSQHQAAACAAGTCVAARTFVPWGVHFAVCAMTLAVARLFGPVLASAAEGFWLMAAPISRRRLLRGRLVAAVAAAGVVGAGVAALTSALSGLPGIGVAAWTVGTGLSASGLMAWSAAAQPSERTGGLRVAQAIATLAAVAAILALVAVASGAWVPTLPPGGEAFAWGSAMAGGAATVLLGVRAHGRLDAIRRARLLSGGSLVSGMQGAMFALDLGLARDILVDREAVERGHVRPTPGRGSGVMALVWRDLQRLVRFPRPLVGVVAAAGVPYIVNALGLALLAPLLVGLALFVSLVPLLGSLRVLSRTGGLARAMPFTTAQLRTATMVVPAWLALGWAVIVTPAMAGVGGGPGRSWPDAAVAALAVAVAGLGGAMRWQTAKPVDFGTPMMATGAGAVPPTLVFNLLRGVDIVALVTAPMLLGAPPVWSLGLGVAVLAILRAGFNAADMQAQAEEQRRQLEAEKARTPERRRVPRPGAAGR